MLHPGEGGQCQPEARGEVPCHGEAPALSWESTRFFLGLPIAFPG